MPLCTNAGRLRRRALFERRRLGAFTANHTRLIKSGFDALSAGLLDGSTRNRLYCSGAGSLRCQGLEPRPLLCACCYSGTRCTNRSSLVVVVVV